MKKKLIAIALVVIILAGVLSGCTLFLVNEERDYKQVVASVTSDGVTANITKGEFLEYYAQQAPTYIQYYGWTAKECTEEFLASLAKKEILVIKAKQHFAKTNSTVDVNSSAYDFLTKSEQGWVTRRANKSFQDAYDSILSQLVADDKANQGVTDEEEDDEDKLAPRKSMTKVDPDETYHKSMSEDEVEDFFTLIAANSLTKMEQKAVDKVKENLVDQYKDYDYFLNQQSESRLLTNFQKEVKEGRVEGTTSAIINDADLVSKYNLTINQQTNQFTTDTAYKTALDGTDLLLVHTNEYVKVKSILLQFTESQKAILAALKEEFKGQPNSEKIINEFRKMLVVGGDASEFPMIVDDNNLGLLVNISNLDYKADSVCSEENCPCVECTNHTCTDEDGHIESKICKIELEDADGNIIKNVDGCTCLACSNNAYEKYNVPYLEVLTMISEAIDKAADEAEAKYDEKYYDVTAEEKAAALPLFIANEKLRVFEEWIYKVNDDPGMFEGKDYVVSPSGKESSYVAEYNALVRAMISEKATKGKMSTTIESYNIGDTTVEIMNKDGVSYIINDFGVHIIMISSAPVDKVINDGKITEQELSSEYILDNGGAPVKDVQYILGQNAIIDFDKDTGKVITVMDSIRKTRKDSLESEIYTQYERALFKDFGTEFFFDKKNLNKEIGGIKITLSSSVYGQISELTGANKKETQQQQ